MQPGTLIGQNVRLVRLLGEGGMGSVWLAEHLTLKTKVAVKLITESLAEDAAVRARFSAEAAAAASVQSPHIVRMLDHGVSSGRPFIVMELLLGESVAERLARTSCLTPEETATILRQTCKALPKAHAAGIVHRDIKPENLFLTDEDGDVCVKVLDFGIARIGGEDVSRTQTGSMIGTPLYMSPEQVKSSRGADARSDLWSLAVVAYRALTGVLPFDGETAGAIFIAIDSGKIRAPSEIAPALGPAMDAWFARALARDREERFQNAKEMSDAFVAAVASPWDVRRAVTPGSLSPVAKSASSSFASLGRPKSALSATSRATVVRASALGVLGILVAILVASVLLRPKPASNPANGIAFVAPLQESSASASPIDSSRAAPPAPPATSVATTWADVPIVVPVVSPSSLPIAPARASSSGASPLPERKKRDRGF